METWISGRGVLRLALAALACVCLVLIPASAALADNSGDVWVDNVGQPAGPGHENDPHLACQDINLWGSYLAGSSGTYAIDGYPPSGSQEQDYAASWSYDATQGDPQVVSVIPVQTLIENAIANGDVPQANQGFHFKLDFSLYPQKHKTFWVDCAVPSITTTAAPGTMGQTIHDQATLSGSNSATGSITWKIYSSSDTKCSNALGAVSEGVNGDGTYTSPAYTPNAPGSYQWVATYSGDAQNLSAVTSCNDPNEQSLVSPATPSIVTHATSNTAGAPIHDVAVLTGGDNPTGTISWNVYPAGSCTGAPLHTSSEAVNGDNTYTSPDWSPGPGSYEWVATYSGDANNSSIASSCSDPNEQSTVQAAPAPGVALIKLERNGSAGSFTHGPITGNVGDTINYQMTVINTGNTSLVITFTDPQCDAGTLSVPTVPAGSFDPSTSTLSAGGELQYTCHHVLAAGDAPQFPNTASVSGQPPQGPPVTASDTVVTLLNTPGMTVTKLQRDGSSGAFTAGTITAMVGDTIQYEIQVANTGNTTLALSLSDPHCDAGTVQGPVALGGTLIGNVLSPGGQAQYTCSHVLGSGDVPTFTNVGTITGQPPSGPPISGSGVVVANVTTAGIRVAKLQRDGSTGVFTSSPIDAMVGDTIEYEIQVTNTGTAPLSLSLSDPLCNAGTISGPTLISGTLSGSVLSAGGEAQYTCSHVLTAGDPSPFTNTATVTGQPPSGPPVSGTSSVTANKQAVSAVTTQSVKPATKPLRCTKGKVKKTKKVRGKKVTVCVTKKKVKRIVISRKPIRPPEFTG
jgi:uncharacterized repeat protein (TIGR01451 family)